MTEVVDIDNTIDKAIIKSLEFMQNKIGSKGLLSGAIKETVKEKFGITKEDEVQSRIRELHKRGILVEVKSSQPRKDTKRVYALDKNMEFNYICGPLPTEVGSREIPVEIRRHHTEALQEAINNWIAFFPQPTAGYPFDPADRYEDDIQNCQNHLLYPDLEYHLHEMGFNVYGEWRRYKEELLRLQKMKIGLLSLVKADISKCFKFKMSFISNSDDGINKYECNHIQKVLYNLVLELSGKIPGQEAHENYLDDVMAFREFSRVLEFEEIIIWEIKGGEAFIVVPKGERDALINGIENYRKFAEMQNEKDKMIKELEDASQHYYLLGDCKYLAGY